MGRGNYGLVLFGYTLFSYFELGGLKIYKGKFKKNS